MSDTPTENLKPWADDVALMGPDTPKNTGFIEHMIEYLLTVHKRFGNTCITCDLQWGSSAMGKRDKNRERVVELESTLMTSQARVLELMERNARGNKELAELRHDIERIYAADCEHLAEIAELRTRYLQLTEQHARLCDQVYEDDGETLKQDTMRAAMKEPVAWLCKTREGYSVTPYEDQAYGDVTPLYAPHQSKVSPEK